ncbi:MAG TPA: hypothetical protein VGI39_11680 [Polyangiaceae bacterium]|jgi:hypothetical protein
MKRFVAALALASLSALAAPARADRTDAETFFEAAKMYRDAGRYEEACPRFAASRALQDGVGVTLYLADCEDHLGHSASAWRAFRAAESLATTKGDPRAATARARASALEPKLLHVRLASTRWPGRVQIDDTPPIPASEASAGIAVDPGEHRVTLLAGKASTTARAYVDAKVPTLTIHVAPPLVLTSAKAQVAAPAADSRSVEPPSRLDGRTREHVELGLLVVAGVGSALGAGFLVTRNQSMTNPGQGTPQVDNEATVGATTAFGIAGAALVSAIVLYLSAPAEKSTALRLTPSLANHGLAGALSGTF